MCTRSPAELFCAPSAHCWGLSVSVQTAGPRASGWVRLGAALRAVRALLPRAAPCPAAPPLTAIRRLTLSACYMTVALAVQRMLDLADLALLAGGYRCVRTVLYVAGLRLRTLFRSVCVRADCSATCVYPCSTSRGSTGAAPVGVCVCVCAPYMCMLCVCAVCARACLQYPR